MTTTRHRGPRVEWRPQARTVELLDQIARVLVEYAEHLPLTARQIFYRLVGTRNYAKTENAYARLCETLVSARRAGRIDFAAIRDDGVTIDQPTGFDDPADFWETVRWTADRYRRARLNGQSVNVEVWAEAAGMVPQLARVAAPWGVPVVSSSGFDSLTAKYDAARRAAADGRPLVVLHIGDLDPSGVHLFSSAAEDVAAWAEHYDAVVIFRRVAVTPEQVDAYGLPTAPPKATDRRRFTGETCQAEALDPATLADLLAAALDETLDPAVRRDAEAAEADERAAILDDIARLRTENHQ